MRAWPKRSVAFHRLIAVLVGAAGGAFFAVVIAPMAAALGLLLGGAYYIVSTERYRRRQRLLSERMGAEHRAVLERSVSFYRRLSDDAKIRFEDDVRIFIAEQTITARAGAEADHDTKLLIAASAAMLTFGLPDFEWPRVRDIVVYPRSFDASYGEGGNIAGMVHLRGPILFSQKDLRHGFRHDRDAHHVGIHEMAHVMDMLDGAADGIPGDLPWVSTAPWVQVVASRLRRVRNRHHMLRDYAGTNEAELFSVAVEAFFEQPEQLRRHDRKLYDMLSGYFNQDPRRPAG